MEKPFQTVGIPIYLSFSGWSCEYVHSDSGTVCSFLCFPVEFFFLQYDIVGHSGDGFDIELVRSDKMPKNNKQRLNVLKVCSLRKYCVHSLMFFPFVWKSASWQAFLEWSHPSDHETWQGVHRQACFSIWFCREGSFTFKETMLVRLECLNPK